MWICTPADIRKFIDGRDQPNSRFLYYSGYSLMDSMVAEEIGKLAYDAAVRGYVYLVKQRIIPKHSEFAYYMIKASKTPVFRLVPLSDTKLRERSKYHG